MEISQVKTYFKGVHQTRQTELSKWKERTKRQWRRLADGKIDVKQKAQDHNNSRIQIKKLTSQQTVNIKTKTSRPIDKHFTFSESHVSPDPIVNRANAQITQKQAANATENRGEQQPWKKTVQWKTWYDADGWVY
jgi:hypothetical protein